MKKPGKTYKIILTIFALTFFFFIGGRQNYNSKFSSYLINLFNETNSGEPVMVWIYFSDKGPYVQERLAHPELFLTQRSIERRSRRIKGGPIFEEADLPLYPPYVQALLQSGFQIKQKSKWFNAVSCISNQNKLQKIAGEDFVLKIEQVTRYKRSESVIETNDNFSTGQTGINTLNYGASFNQSNLINVPSAHELGYAGEGVLIALFDAGVDNLQHPCFNRIRESGLRTYDFLNGDTIIANGPGRLGQGYHGTWTLSLLGGFDPGFLVSPAFNSQYLIAKTENDASEFPIEEDNWVAAAEWADSLGADIISSSVGYDDFDPPYQSHTYTWEDMNGNTAKVTKAANIAVNKGMIVVNSAGNAGIHLSHNTLSAPADGFNVITVGSVSLNRLRSAHSSIGPTVDGRIKPDVMALGVNNIIARSGSGNTGYTTGIGTSMATPMVAGVCALMLSANPKLTPQQVVNIIRNTADSSLTPNSRRGWGIVNALNAVVEGMQLTENFPGDYELAQNYPNPFNPSTTFRFSLKKSANITLKIYDISGRVMSTVLDNVEFGSGSKEVKFNFVNTGISSGVYFYTLYANGTFVDAKKMVIVF